MPPVSNGSIEVADETGGTLHEVSPHADAERDLFRRKVNLHLRETFFPLGFPLEVATNSEIILDAARDSWGHFQSSFDVPSLRLEVGVSHETSGAFPNPPVCRSQDNLLALISDADNFAICDLDKAFAFSWLTPVTARNKNFIRYFFLDAVAMCLLSSSYVTAIHAACVRRAEYGFLLCGDSGAGKSSLAFACARAGWTYVSDDASYILQKTSDRIVVGNHRQIRFRPSASSLFPELEGIGITPRAAGKPSIEVPIESLKTDIVTSTSAKIDYVVFLNRQESSTQELIPFANDSARLKLLHSLYGTLEVQELQASALDSLLGSTNIYELRYHDLHWAVSRLEALVTEKT